MRASYVFGAVALAMTLAGCGGGDSTTSTTSVATGTGTYVDSAVAGVSYTCGSRSGVTDENGSFTYEVGQSCTFKIGNIQLRSVAADHLVDGVKILENNVSVAQMLQTLDNDGDPSNGITVSSEIMKAITDAGITSVPGDMSELTTLYTVVQNVSGYTGHVVNEQDALTHLNDSLSSELKSMLAGKTFYLAGNGDGYPIMEKITVNSDLTQIGWVELDVKNNYAILASGTDNVELNASVVRFLDEPGHTETFVGQTEDYFELEAQDGSSVRLYFDKTKAKAYYDTLGYDAKAFVHAFMGLPLYNVGKDNTGKWIEKVDFTMSAASSDLALIFSDLNGNMLEIYPSITFDGAKMIMDATHYGTFKYYDIANQYLEITIEDGTTERVYGNLAKAQAYYDSL